MNDPQVPIALLIVAGAAFTLLRGPVSALWRARTGKVVPASGGGCHGCSGCAATTDCAK